MYQQQVNVINSFRMICDALSVIVAGYAAHYLYLYLHPEQWTLGPSIFIATILTIMFLNNYVMGRFRLYGNRKPSSYIQLLWGLASTVIVDFAVVSAGIILIAEMYANRQFFVYFIVFTFILLVFERTILLLSFDHPSFKSYNLRRILIVGDIDRGRIVAERMQKQLSWGHEIVGNLTSAKDNAGSLGHIDDLQRVLHEHAIDEVIFALGADRDVNLSALLKICRRMGITARIIPALWSPDDKGILLEECQGIPFLTFRENNFNATGLLYKRILDLIGGMVGSLIFLIVYPFVALAIKLDSPGPVLFKQQRVGQNRRIFDVYKFRSMYLDAENRKQELMDGNEMQGAMFKIKDDPRITRVGRFIRKTSIDEIPQFLNVLKGEMSLVGTRPPTTDEVNAYQDWHYRRISAKPGMTGLWQISGRSQVTDFDEIVEMDCAYLQNWRFLDDIKILLKTIWVVILGRGAE